MESSNQAAAGPSTVVSISKTKTKLKSSRKPKSAHPDQPRHPKRSLPPPLPQPPTNPSRLGGTTATHPHLPIKVLQGVGTRRTDSTKQGFGKEVIFVTRKTSLGAFIGRCRSLVVDEGYTHLVLHSLGAAIPHSLLLLHAVLDALPYPRGPRGLWYEIHTGTSECVDHIEIQNPARPVAKLPKKSKKEKQKKKAEGVADDGEDVVMAERAREELIEEEKTVGERAVPAWLAGIGSVEAAAPIRQVRMTSSMKIDIYIGPKPSVQPTAPTVQSKQSKPGEGRSRPNKKRRTALLAQQALEKEVAVAEKADKKKSSEADEEDMNNAQDEEEEEEEEPIEEVEE